MHVGIALGPMHLAEPPALPRTPHANHVAELITGMSDADSPLVDRKIQSEATLTLAQRCKTKVDPHC